MNVELLREICLKLPGATEEIKWEHDLAFCVGGKMFCVTSFDEPFKCTVKVLEEEFDELINREGFAPAHYLARAKWVSVSNNAKLPKAEWQQLLQQSHRLIAKKLTKKQRVELGIF